MRPEQRDPGYFWDMLDTARSVREFTTGVTAGEYLKDRKLQLAVERALEIIGEAARLVSATFKANHVEIPWKQIIGQRNVLAHEYGEINTGTNLVGRESANSRTHSPARTTTASSAN
jgi:uncharacterized protein with HEPN domain